MGFGYDTSFAGYDEAGRLTEPYGNQGTGSNTFINMSVNPPRCGRYFVAKKELISSYTFDYILEFTEILLYSADP